MMNARGLTLTGLLVSIIALAVLMLLMGSVSSFFSERLRDLQQKSIKISVGNLIAKSLSNTATCSCLLNSPDNPKPIVIDTTKTSFPNVDLTSWRWSCDYKATNNIAAEVNQPLESDGPVVDSIRLVNLQSADPSGRMTGQLRIDFKKGKSFTPTPLVTHLAFAINASAGTADARPILRCLGPTAVKRSLACPTGFTIVGKAEEESSFCVENDLHPAVYQDDADAYCKALKVSEFGKPDVCDISQVVKACLTGVLKPGAWEIFGGKGGGPVSWVALGADCYSMGINNGKAPFRCCVR